MKKLLGCCMVLALLCLTAFAADAANAQSEVQRLESQLAAADNPAEVKLIKAELEELFAIHPPLVRSGNLDDVPANDLCENAEAIAIGATASGSTAEATFDDVGTCGTSNTAPGVWFSVVGNNHVLTATTCDQAQYDTKITVFIGTCDNLVCVDGNDDDSNCSGNTSTVDWCATEGITYLILVHGWNASVGTFDLSIIEGEDCSPPTPPANDLCAEAISAAVPSIVQGTTVNATADLGPVCGDFLSNRLGVWYSIIGTGHEITLSTCDEGTSYDTQIGVYTGDCGALVCVAGNDDNCGLQSSVSFCSDFGVEYLVLIHGYQTNTGDFVLHIEDSGFDCHCFAPEVIHLNIIDALPLCQCIYVCADQEMTICVGPLGPNEAPAEISLTPGCRSVDDPLRLPGEGCDDPECPPVIPDPVDEWTYHPETGEWCITIVSAEDGCFCFCLDEILPVELNAFEAIAGDAEVTLNWSTASESDNDRFEIMRDNTVVASIEAGNSPTGGSYHWTDRNLVNGREYGYTLIAVGINGLREQMAAAAATPSVTSATISEYALHQNFPNPFNPETSISFDILDAGMVTLTVYNAIGQKVATLVNGELSAGRHAVDFTAGSLPSGIYFYRLEAGDFTANKKMVLMK